MMSEVEEAVKELFAGTDLFDRLSAQARAEGEARGEAKGKAEGEVQGNAKTARKMTLQFLTRRFGELPEALVQQIETADADWCQSLFDRAIGVASLAELAQE